MSETEKRKIEELETEYLKEFLKADKERTHRRYLNIGAVAGIIFVFISTSFDRITSLMILISHYSHHRKLALQFLQQ